MIIHDFTVMIFINLQWLANVQFRFPLGWLPIIELKDEKLYNKVKNLFDTDSQFIEL